jgi:hypothetical protein
MQNAEYEKEKQSLERDLMTPAEIRPTTPSSAKSDQAIGPSATSRFNTHRNNAWCVPIPEQAGQPCCPIGER